MKVSELIEKLQALDGDRVVCMARDAEGNGFGPLTDMGECTFDAHETESIGIEELTPELKGQGYSEDDMLNDGVPAVCLWPGY